MSSNVMFCLKIQNIVKTSKSSRCWHLRDLNKISFFDLLMRIDLNNSIHHQNSCPLIFCWSNTPLTTCRPYQKLTSLTYIQHPHYINDNIEPSCAQVTVSFQSLFFSDLMFYVPVVIRLIHLPSPPWRQHDPFTSSWMELNVLWYFLEILASQSVMSLQDASFSYDPETPPGEIQSEVLFREGQTLGGHVTNTPRLIAMDLKGNFSYHMLLLMSKTSGAAIILQLNLLFSFGAFWLKCFLFCLLV